MLIFKKKFLDKNRQRHKNLEADDIKIKFYFTVCLVEFWNLVRLNQKHPFWFVVKTLHIQMEPFSI